MKKIGALSSVVFMLCLSADVMAEANWRRGNLYFKEVCNACHRVKTGKPVSPNSRTQAEWTAYFKADKHAPKNQAIGRISDYTSKEYRETMESEIPALVLFFDRQSSEILANIEAHLVHHAKDADTPSNCM